MLRPLSSPPSVIIPGRDISKMSLDRRIVTKTLKFTTTAIIERENVTRGGQNILQSFGKLSILRCMRFLGRIEGWIDPTWCYHVYGTYTPLQEQKVQKTKTMRAKLTKR
jgi:hypothetical protein